MSGITDSSSMVDIYEYQDKTDKLQLMEELNYVIKNSILSQNTICNILACSIARKDSELSQFLLGLKEYGLKEVLKTCFILDTERYVRQLEKRYAILAKQSNFSNARLVSLKSKLESNKKLDGGMGKSAGFILNGTNAKFIRKNWVQTMSELDLEICAMGMPTRQWQRLADILHIKKSDFALDWFLSYIYGNPAPENSMLNKFKRVLSNNLDLTTFLKETNVPYDKIRYPIIEQKMYIPYDAKIFIGKQLPVDKYIWYWEEINTPEVDEIAVQTINSQSGIDITYGKLMERILTIRNSGKYSLYKTLLAIAEGRMTNMKMDIGKVAILGDASASMQVAINTSMIVASALSNLCDAELRLFRTVDEKLSTAKSAEDVIDMSQKYKAGNATAPAASLWPYYNSKQHIDTFIVVTDEEENTTHSGKSTWSYGRNVDTDKGYMFAPLFKKYLEEVNSNAKLVFISFTRTGVEGHMEGEIKNHIPSYDENMKVFKMDSIRPDLTKLDKIIHNLKH